MAKQRCTQADFVAKLANCFSQKDNAQLTSLLTDILTASSNGGQKGLLALAFSAVDTLASQGRLFRAAHCLKLIATTLPEDNLARVQAFNKAITLADHASRSTPLISIAALYGVPKGLSAAFQEHAGQKAYALAEMKRVTQTRDLKGLAALYNLAAQTLPHEEERIEQHLSEGIRGTTAQRAQDLKGLADMIRTAGDLRLNRGKPVDDLATSALDAGILAVARHSSDQEGLLDLFSLASLYTDAATPAHALATDMVIWLEDGRDSAPPEALLKAIIHSPTKQQRQQLIGPRT